MDKTHEMWGGRFDQSPATIMQKINASIDIDKRLYREDIAGSIAHVKMLSKQKIITSQDSEKIISGLNIIKQEIESGQFEFKIELEDIHMNIEARLHDIIGDVAGKMHTARSRNDQVATDMRLWLRSAINSLLEEMNALMKVLSAKSDVHYKTVMPGFTHLQIAQPITFGLHIDAYVRMIERDGARLKNCQERLNESPLGACALAGTEFNIDRHMTSRVLGFSQPMANTLDAVSARDFILEFLSSISIYMQHLSRLSEELIIWSTPQFGYITLDDAFSTGSSIMPQKRNPDAAELIRAKTGRSIGCTMQFFTIMKALPLAYNKDMQEDKELTFDVFDTAMLSTKVMSGMIETMKVHDDKMLEDAEQGYSTATRLADWLVMKCNLPFRQAHYVTGQIVKRAEQKKCRLSDLDLIELQSIYPDITEDIFKVLSVIKPSG